jgi:HD-like signal output (HDOD) protein
MKLAELLKNTPSLPVTLEVLAKITRIMKDSDTGAHEIISVISTDPLIVAGVLKLENYEPLHPCKPRDGSG